MFSEVLLGGVILSLLSGGLVRAVSYRERLALVGARLGLVCVVLPSLAVLHLLVLFGAQCQLVAGVVGGGHVAGLGAWWGSWQVATLLAAIVPVTTFGALTLTRPSGRTQGSLGALSLLILIGLGFTLTSSVVTLVITFELLLLVSIFLLRLTAKSERAVEAALEMFVWTLVGSAAFLAALVSVTLSGQMPTLGAAYVVQPLPTLAVALLCLGFGVKLPIWPCFSWLLKAHVEASVEFSILLSGIVVKFGALGLYRILSLQGDGVIGLILVGCCTIAMLEATLRLLAQRDLKRIVALTTVIEINWVGVCLGLGGPQLERVAAFVIVAHSITTTAEFFMVECIYRRYQTRDLLHIAGLATQAPALYALSFVNLLTTLGFPGTSLFAAKVLFLTAVAQTSLTLLVGFALLLVFALPVIFMRIWLPVWFGQATAVPTAVDLSAREATILTLCVVISLSLGFYPALLPL